MQTNELKRKESPIQENSTMKIESTTDNEEQIQKKQKLDVIDEPTDEIKKIYAVAKEFQTLTRGKKLPYKIIDLRLQELKNKDFISLKKELVETKKELEKATLQISALEQTSLLKETFKIAAQESFDRILDHHLNGVREFQQKVNDEHAQEILIRDAKILELTEIIKNSKN